jgi:uncharacterized protein YpuA (DUF1002 family)
MKKLFTILFLLFATTQSYAGDCYISPSNIISCTGVSLHTQDTNIFFSGDKYARLNSSFKTIDGYDVKVDMFYSYTNSKHAISGSGFVNEIEKHFTKAISSVTVEDLKQSPEKILSAAMVKAEEDNSGYRGRYVKVKKVYTLDLTTYPPI